MLSSSQLERFETDGYLVVENLLDADTITEIKQEYSDLMDRLYADWFDKGMVGMPPDGLSIWQKLEHCYKGGFDWYQPFDISLPHEDIAQDTPMHFGPAVFKMATHPRILDVVEQLIGPEITSNPIQHVRIKPPAHAVPQSEVRAHVTTTETLHPDAGLAQGVGFELAPLHAAAPFLADEARIGEDAEVFGNGGQRHLKWLGHVCHGHVVFEQHRKDRPSGGVSNGGKDDIERLGHGPVEPVVAGKVNRLVECPCGCGTLLQVRCRVDLGSKFNAIGDIQLLLTLRRSKPIPCREPKGGSTWPMTPNRRTLTGSRRWKSGSRG